MTKKKPRKIYGKQAHYWSPDLELSWLVAFCIDYATQYSKEADTLFNKIVEAWDKPDCKKELEKDIEITAEEIASTIPAIKKHKQIKPDFDYITELQKDADESDDKRNLIALAEEFVKVAFNRKTDLKEGKQPISLYQSSKLCQVILMLTAGSCQERQDGYQETKQLNVGNTTLDISPLVDGVTDNRKHRKYSKVFKHLGYRLRNTEKLKTMARYWYQSRVAYSGPEEFCRRHLLDKGIELDPANISKEIMLCDKAMGYPRRNMTK